MHNRENAKRGLTCRIAGAILTTESHKREKRKDEDKMRKQTDAPAFCCRCRESFRPGDAYYDVPGEGIFCPDCMEALTARWRREEGDVVDRC